MKRTLAVLMFLTIQALGTQWFSFSYGGRTYTVTTTFLSPVFTWDSSHWLYEPSVVLPSPQTNYQYVLLFSSGTGFRAQGIYATTSTSPTSFPSPPVKVLDIAATSNLCDMIDARPYYDGSMWHVYVQAIETCPGNPSALLNAVYEATGATLGNLAWVCDYGSHAQKVITSVNQTSGIGIGEGQQWYNTGLYLGPASLPFTAIFNDWGYVGQDCRPFNPNGSYNCYDYCPLCAFNGTDLFNYIGPNGTSPMYFWDYRQAPSAIMFNGGLAIFNPDVILGGSLDGPTAGNPAIGFTNYSDQYGQQWPGAIGFFPDPIPFGPYGNRSPQGGLYFPGYLEPWAPTMLAPRIARNPYGYLDPVPGSSPLTWQTYFYYNDTRVKGAGSRFSVSSLTITQQ